MDLFKILFVDDEEINLINFKLIFQDRYEIITAVSGEDALEYFKHNRDIGLVISDQQMPGISGIEMLSRMYSINSDPIRVLLTAHSKTEFILDAVNKGHIYQYILKPWNATELSQLIERCRGLYLLKKQNISLTHKLAEKNRNLELINNKLRLTNDAFEVDVLRRKKLEASLRESEERFSKFTHASQDMIILFNAQGRAIYTNPAAEKLLIYSGEADFMIFPLTSSLHPDDQAIVRKEVFQLLKDSTPSPARELQIMLKDGSYLDVEMSFFAIDLENGERLLGSIVRDIAKRKEAEKNLILSEERLRNLSAMLITAQDDERRRIAMELHDEFGQSLAALKLQLRGLENSLYNKDEFPKDQIIADLQELRQYVNILIDNVRHLSRDLWPMVVDNLGVDAAFETLFSGFLDYSDIKIDANLEPVGQFFSVEEQRHIYRLLQESLNNVVKHAEAESIQVSAKVVADDVILGVYDDGCGFDVEEVARHTDKSCGMGLQAMAERVKILNGQMDMTSIPGKGTSIIFTFSTDRAH